MNAEIRTFRARRTWFEKLLLWPRAYESKMFDHHREVIGRGHTPRAAQEAAERQWSQSQRLAERMVLYSETVGNGYGNRVD
jgi:hypothetical protein